MTLEDKIKEVDKVKVTEAFRNLEKLIPFMMAVIAIGAICDVLSDFQVEPKKEPINEFLYYKNPRKWLYIKKCQ